MQILLIPWPYHASRCLGYFGHQTINRRVIDHAENKVLASLEDEFQQSALFHCHRNDIKVYRHISCKNQQVNIGCIFRSEDDSPAAVSCWTPKSGIKPQVPDKAIVLNVAQMLRLNLSVTSSHTLPDM